MKYQTFSIVSGSEICNAACPFCVSRQTGFDGVERKITPINVRNFMKAANLAYRSGTNTVIITGKGEPTLHPQQITDYLTHLNKFDFPFIELQTNGTMIAKDLVTDTMLSQWYLLGMTTVLISVVHYEPEINRQTYMPKAEKYFDLPTVIKKIQDSGINVRLTCVGLDGYIDSSEKILNLMKFAKDNNVRQVSWRPVNAPDKSEDSEVSEWTKKHFLKVHQKDDIINYVRRHGTLIQNLVHGAQVYDLNGQNLCLSNCLTRNPEEETARQLIFFPNGDLYTDWQFKGSVLL
jgi:molybdenum cofactor biosynthesis enzyme MoaA